MHKVRKSRVGFVPRWIKAVFGKQASKSTLDDSDSVHHLPTITAVAIVHVKIEDIEQAGFRPRPKLETIPEVYEKRKSDRPNCDRQDSGVEMMTTDYFAKRSPSLSLLKSHVRSNKTRGTLRSRSCTYSKV
ncbi:uncharacterized protein SPPG_09296 [Spizellomyces punctatus DAOM BR117]|uniref:Uncharacterized protein n=1 Tax=Spizellomyces punctatus (strain DAOM BR117) TaxID=645134 RepID=A0A0L0HEQ7_SPIPD|nr:uncharacterized protein SPPG_09296 [Spizellomyces punctatus DAOM BR117]KNC99469.1 hypothetical protein SPPG_09296 [Spizellomyces punctatus DAOM BR117]|eukprot:XP_016607509.1 hypothetical protein SPPG_09296 [Spizellomyces punctatus DAOM BR117]